MESHLLQLPMLTLNIFTMIISNNGIITMAF